MGNEKRYTEEEIAAIFEEAALSQEMAQQHLAATEGLTLSELIEVGEEAGISSSFIVRASRTVEGQALAPKPKEILGQTVTVHRSVELSDNFSDEDWARDSLISGSIVGVVGLLAVLASFVVSRDLLAVGAGSVAVGVAMLSYANYKLPRWIQERSGQMKAIADRFTVADDKHSGLLLEDLEPGGVPSRKKARIR